jgi:hypothetical protein
VVDVAELGGFFAAGEAAREIADPDKVLQRGRRPVTPLRGVAGSADLFDLGAAADQLGEQRRRDNSAPKEQAGRRLVPSLERLIRSEIAPNIAGHVRVGLHLKRR